LASCRFLAGRQNSGSIASQISHQGIDLGQGDAQQVGAALVAARRLRLFAGCAAAPAASGLRFFSPSTTTARSRFSSCEICSERYRTASIGFFQSVSASAAAMFSADIQTPL
jgi:hypothetical protein